jgi:NodT family efflux transporter outer membrane factor (OMF) lipoprotein
MARRKGIKVVSKVCGRIRVALFLAICSIIAGCAGTHGIAPVDAPLAVNTLDAGAAIKAAACDADWPDSQWWHALHDPQLDHLITQALADSPSMAVAAARVRLASAMAAGTGAALSPQLKLDASIAREHWPDNYFYGPGLLGSADTWNNTVTLGLSYDLDLWGKNQSLASRSLDQAHAAAADARAAQLDLESNIVRSYIGFSLQYALRDNLVRILAEQQRILDFANARLKGGIGTQLEVSQAQTPLPETQRQIDVLDEQLSLQRNQLAALIGQGPGAGDGLLRPALSATVQIGLPANLPLDLIGHRPDVVAQRWRIEADSKGIAAAKAGFYPNINLSVMAGGFAAAGGPVGGGFLSFLGHNDLSYSAGPALSLPIFDGGRLRAQLGAAAADYDIEVDRYNQIVLGALKQIADQLVTLRALDRQQIQVEQSLATARTSDKLASEGFRRGLTDYLNVLNAQTHLVMEEQNQQRIMASRLDAYAALMAALGGGVLDAETAAAAPPVAATPRTSDTPSPLRSSNASTSAPVSPHIELAQ